MQRQHDQRNKGRGKEQDPGIAKAIFSHMGTSNGSTRSADDYSDGASQVSHADLYLTAEQISEWANSGSLEPCDEEYFAKKRRSEIEKNAEYIRELQ